MLPSCRYLRIRTHVLLAFRIKSAYRISAGQPHSSIKTTFQNHFFETAILYARRRKAETAFLLLCHMVCSILRLYPPAAQPRDRVRHGAANVPREEAKLRG